MTRYREKSPSGTYFVSSYVIRAESNLRDGKSRKMLKKIARRARKKFGFKFFKLQVQKNSFTMLVSLKTGRESMICEILQWIKSIFAKWWNKTHKMRGTFWADRFDSELREVKAELDDYVKARLTCLYIVYSKNLHTLLTALRTNYTLCGIYQT